MTITRFLFVAALLLGAAGAQAQTTEGLAKPTTPATVEAAKLSKLPKQTKFVEAEYPAAAAEQGIEAEVVLLLDIDATGHVAGAIVTEPPTPPGLGFEEAATAAALQYEFEPAEMDGKPIAVQLAYKVKFKLKEKAPPSAPAAANAPPPPPRTPVENFTGVLKERGTRLPLAGVVVTIFREGDGKTEGYEATTDGEGRFRFFDLGPGEWKVLVEAPGYFPFRTTETIAANEAVSGTFYVERGSYNPYDVTVTATRPRKEVSRTVIDAKIADKIPGTAGDPLAVVQNFAGVAQTPIAGVLVVRGSAPEDTKIFADGAEIPIPYHFGGLRSVLPVGMLESIEFYPGNFSPMYGRATGGIVDIQIKKLEPPKLGGYADVSILDSSLYLEAPIGKRASIALSGRRSYLDAVINAAVPEDAPVNILQAPRYYDYQLLANYRPTAAHDLRLLFFGSDDALRLLFQNPAAADPTIAIDGVSQKTSFYRTLLSWRYTPSDRISNDLRLSQGRNKFAVRAGPLILDVDFYTVQARDNLRVKLADSLAVNVGFDIGFGKADALVQLPLPPKEGEPQNTVDLSRLLRSETKGELEFYPAAYTELEWRPIPQLLLLPGLRVERFARAKGWIAQPRVTARLEASEGLVLKGGAGLYSQQADITQGEDDPVFGNPNLTAERARHYSVGVEYKPRPHITLDATAFYKDLYSLVSKTDAVIQENGMPKPLRYDNNGTGRVVGLELVARHDFTRKFTGWIAYTLSKSERLDSGKAERRLFDFDQTHIFTAVASYLLPRNWQIGGRFRLVSGMPNTPITGAIYNSSTDRYEPVYGAVNSARAPLFNQLDIRIDKRWIYDSWLWGFYLDIQNVYNRVNEVQPDYNYDYRQKKAQQSLPILPIIGLRAEF